MPIITVRPDATLQKGVWDIVGPVGAAAHQVVNDDNDLTWLEVPGLKQVLNDADICKLSIQDFDIPTGAKIFAVRARARVEKIVATPDNPNPPTPRPGCGFHRHGFLEDLLRFIFVILMLFFCPRKPVPPGGTDPGDPPLPAEWGNVDLQYYLEQPGGGEWTEESFNDFFVSLFRSDVEDVTLRFGEVWVDLEYNEQPVVTVTGPVGPLTDITLPTTTWEFVDPEGDSQAAFWWRSFDEATYTAPDFDPATAVAFDETPRPDLNDGGWVLGADTFWTARRDHPNGNYRAYVKTKQVWKGIGSHESEWAYHQWAQEVPGPPSPSLSATFEPDLDRVRLDLHEGGSSPATDTYDIFYSDDLAYTWELVRDGSKVDIDAVRDSTIYDYEAPHNKVRLYRAQAFRVLNSILVTSGYSNEVSVIARIDGFRLKDLVVPALSMRLNVHDLSWQAVDAVGVVYPLTSTDPAGREARAIALVGPEYGVKAKMVLTFRTDAEYDAFMQLKHTRRQLFLQYPTGEQHYIQLLGDMDSGKWIMKGDQNKLRQPSISWVDVDKPPVPMLRKLRS